MAFKPTSLTQTESRGAAVRMEPLHVHPRTFAAVAGGGTLRRAVPVSYNTNTNLWVAWGGAAGTNGTNLIKGFAAMDIVLNDSGTNNYEVIGSVMLSGNIHYADLETLRAAGSITGTATDLKAALRTGLREIGLMVVGLDQVR